MNFKYMESFLSVAEELNITQAAERLYISQQALSEQMKRLEQYYGVNLFAKSLIGRGLVLTPAGRLLYESATQILQINKQLLTYYSEMDQATRGEIRLAITSPRAQLILPTLLSAFKVKFPNISIHIATARHSEELVKFILNGSADIALSFNRLMEPNIISISLAKERLFGLATLEVLRQAYQETLEPSLPQIRTGIYLNQIINLPLLLLSPRNQVRKILNALFVQYNTVPNVALEIDDTLTLCNLATQSMGVAFCGEYIISTQPRLFEPNGEKTVIAFPLLDESTGFDFSIGYHRKHYLSIIEKNFIEELRCYLNHRTIQGGNPI